MYAATIALTTILYVFFAGSGCGLNRFFITLNLVLVVAITLLCVHPLVQEYNPRSGLAQSSMVAIYCTYLVVSAVSNHAHEQASCNPLRSGAASGTRNTTIILGGVFTFLAIAYSTTRAATQSKALVGKGKKGGSIQLPVDEQLRDHSELAPITNQPLRTETPRYQALLAAVEAGWVIFSVYELCDSSPCPHSAIPASALNEDDEEEEEEDFGESRDDEKSGTRYSVCSAI